MWLERHPDAVPLASARNLPFFLSASLFLNYSLLSFPFFFRSAYSCYSSELPFLSNFALRNELSSP